MKKLIEHTLFGSGLILVNKQLLIDRYNECLKDIGIKQTSLSSFHIDKWGWSPEIADEFKNKDYLSFGYANPFAIIITPEQQQAHLYYPLHSFDWDLMETVFKVYENQIRDITTQYGLWLELQQQISTYRSPQDFLSIDTIDVKFYTPSKIIVATREQKSLVRQFYEEKSAWTNEALQVKILDSVIKHGDLRNRHFEINQLPYTKTKSFYTRAFEGLFIIRASDNPKAALIFENNTSTLSGDDSFSHLEFNLNDIKLYSFLIENNLIQSNFNHFRNDIFSVMTLRDSLLITLITKTYPEEEIDFTNDRLKTKYINMLATDKKLTEEFYALEDIIVKLSRNEPVKNTDYPIDIRLALSYPNPLLDEEQKRILWRLLSKLSPIKDILIQYLFNKNQFYTDYQTWTENKKDWAIQVIKENKIPMYNYKLKKK
jgi:hypothetical protein